MKAIEAEARTTFERAPVGRRTRCHAADAAGATFIVAMRTPDGFEVSFGFEPAERRNVGRSIEAAAASNGRAIQLD